MRETIIKENESGQRLDKYLKKYLPQAPGSFIYKMLRKKNITLNGKKAAGQEKLNTGDSIKFFLAEETIDKFTGNAAASESYPVKKDLKIIYEDDNILLINKPAGMLSQKAKKERCVTGGICDWISSVKWFCYKRRTSDISPWNLQPAGPKHKRYGRGREKPGRASDYGGSF